MNEVLKIEVQAQVAQAQAALRQLQTSLKGTEQAAKGTTAQMPKLGQGTNQATTALTNFGRIASDAPFGLIGIANNIEPLVQSLVLLKTTSGGVGGALKALGGSLLGGGGLILGISLLTSAAQFAALGFDRWGSSTKKAKEEQDKANEAIGNSIRQITKQKEEVIALANVVRDNANSEEVRVNALRRLNDIIPDTVGKLNQKNIAEKEGIKVIAAYVKALEAQATAELLIGRIAENNVKLFENRQKALDAYAAFEQGITNLQIKQEKARSEGRFEEAESIGNQIRERKRLNDISQQSNNIFRKNSDAILLENQNLRKEYERLIPKFDELFKTEKPKQLKEEIKKLNLELKNIPEGLPNLIDIPESDINKLRELQFSLDALANAKEKLKSNPLTSSDISSITSIGGGVGDLEKLNQLAGESNKLNKSLELSDQLINSIANEFADLFTNLSKDGVKAFEDIAKSIAQTTQRILIQYAVTQALKALLNTISSGTGSAVDLAGLSKTTLRGRDLDILQLRGLIG